jgi:NAD(P)-dependent dehydrogenase (short-subunit alcohol dehydrogenase family)
MSSKTLGQQVAIVTGASSGIGRATAIALAIEGAIVIVNHFPSEEALTPKPSSARLVTPGGAPSLSPRTSVAKTVSKPCSPRRWIALASLIS